jgi:ADP-ribose pyrophosphatase YjhB (NUDIX family)
MKLGWTYCPACGSRLTRPANGTDAIKCANPGCHFVLYRNPVPIVAVLILDGDRFLLCRRKPTTFEGGKWCLPCGYVEFHEDFLTASRREVKDETGLEVEITGLLSVASNFLHPDVHTLAIALLAKPIGGRHERRKDHEYRESAEQRRLALENLSLENRVISERIRLAKEIGATDRDLAPLLNELVFKPLVALDRYQDKGVIEHTEIPSDPGVDSQL